MAAWLGSAGQHYSRALASPRLTVSFFVLMAAGALLTVHGDADPTLAMLPPFALLALNLAAAIATNVRFRADLPLLFFHLALLALVALLAVARLTYFDGATILTSGTAFEGNLVRDQRGPLHGDAVRSLHFGNEGFTENFPERGKFHATYNRVRWWDEEGKSRFAEIGDDRPLVLDGYRIYATSRRGFSPLFYWQPATGAAGYGTVQLPDSDSAGLGPTTEWPLPNGPKVWVMLELDAPSAQLRVGQRADLGAQKMRHHLVLRVGERRLELRPGESVDVDGGRLTYVRLASWMGYRIVYDPTEPWLVATVIVGIVSLLWFYARLLRRSGECVLLEVKQLCDR
ncbi:MAG TPA: hypothetical protein VGK14_04950 [Novimethylophilus sp.]|jgi:cytochrome c biogenesis protein|uniref:cytochrome c biogenesis protein ResB n=1 Tax=Novimethylophilus sp. TaxID=2137426 RepID=UPI002F41F445